MKKGLRITVAVILCAVFAVLYSLLGFKLFDQFQYRDFYGSSQAEFSIPGLNQGYIPQGFEYYKEKDLFLACGYMNDKTASRVYVIDRDGNSYFTKLTKANGDDYSGHAGGLTYFGDFLYIAGRDGLDVFSLSDILNKDKKEAKQQATLNTLGLTPAFCFTYNGEIFAGDFYREGSHPTDEKFHLPVSDGKTNKAMMLSFQTDSNSPFGINTQMPTAVYSIPDKVQGIAITEDGKMVLSTSYALAKSELFVHDLSKIKANLADYSPEEPSTSERAFGINLPMYIVDNSSLEQTIIAPPMAEEIVYLENKLWIMNESACNKYIFGKFTTGRYLFSTKIPKK